MSQDLRCDNFTTCSGVVYDRGEWVDTEQVARAKGWHMYAGLTESGNYINVVLCAACVGSPRQRLPKAPDLLPGQLELDLGGDDEAGEDHTPEA